MRQPRLKKSRKSLKLICKQDDLVIWFRELEEVVGENSWNE